MKSADVNENVGFGRTQVDPWDRIQLALIEEIDSNSEVRYEIFKLSGSKIPSAGTVKVRKYSLPGFVRIT